MHKARPFPEDAQEMAFLVIDHQEKFLKIMDKKVTRQVVGNIILAGKTFKQLEVPCFITEHYKSGLGPTQKVITDTLKDVTPLQKTAFSCAGEEGFLEEIKKTRKKTIVVSGLETHVCVYQTVMDLLNEHYEVIVLSDAVQSSKKEKWRSGLRLMDQAGALIMPTETLLFCLLGDAKHEHFKEFSRNLQAPHPEL